MLLCLVSPHTRGAMRKRRPRNGTAGRRIAIFTTNFGHMAFKVQGARCPWIPHFWCSSVLSSTRRPPRFCPFPLSPQVHGAHHVALAQVHVVGVGGAGLQVGHTQRRVGVDRLDEGGGAEGRQ